MGQQVGALGHFGDARRAAMGSTLIERVMETGSLVIRKLGCDRAGEMAVHRFLKAPSVTTEEMIDIRHGELRRGMPTRLFWRL